jgi:PAS domain S-box-containing protein
MQVLSALFSAAPYMPHGYCSLWNPGLIRLHVIADSLIALSFFSIPFTLGYFVRKRRDLADLQLEQRVEGRTSELKLANEEMVREIEQREHLQQTLSASEEQLRLALEASGLGLWDWDLRTDEVTWSAQSFRIFGFEPSARKFDVMSLVALVHPDDRAAIQLGIDEALRPDGIFDAEYRIHRQDGQLCWLMTRGRTHCDSTGQPIRMIGLTLDVTESKQTAEELRRSEERFRLLVEGIADYAIFMLDPAGFVSSWNSGAERIRGYRAQEIIGQHFSCFYCDEDLRQGKPAMALREAAAQERFEEEGWRLRKDGSRFYANSILTSLRDQQGELIGFAKITQDLTESRRAEEAVQTAQAELARVVRASTLGELTASIAHEINQPLAAIVNNANASRRILATAAPDLEEVRQAVEDIAEAGTRTGEIISRIRTLLKKGAPERCPLDINQVIHEVLSLMPSVLERHHVSVEMELADEAPLVLADRVQLQQVLLNLSMNGIEAMNLVDDRPRVLRIRSDVCESGLEVTVQDSGPGLDPRHVPHIFDTFFTTKTNGMGMGLSISRSIVEAHSGRLWASLDPAAQGASFHFSLPAMG